MLCFTALAPLFSHSSLGGARPGARRQMLSNTAQAHDRGDFDEGGKIHDYDARWQRSPPRAARSRSAASAGRPAPGGGPRSARMALLLRLFGSLSFHQARHDDGTPALQATQWMVYHYPADISDWIIAKGGPVAMPMRGLLDAAGGEVMGDGLSQVRLA